jgi:arabinose-5-phosphate isomerase
VMVDAPLPTHAAGDTVLDAITTLAKLRGLVAVVSDDRRLEGVFTTGDLARLLQRDRHLVTAPLGDVMHRGGKVARPEELGSQVVYRMEQHGIIAMPVVDDAARVVGVVHLHDLMRAGAA